MRVRLLADWFWADRDETFPAGDADLPDELARALIADGVAEAANGSRRKTAKHGAAEVETASLAPPEERAVG